MRDLAGYTHLVEATFIDVCRARAFQHPLRAEVRVSTGEANDLYTHSDELPSNSSAGVSAR